MNVEEGELTVLSLLESVLGLGHMASSLLMVLYVRPSHGHNLGRESTYRLSRVLLLGTLLLVGLSVLDVL
jgi:hypothetical protein